jgi:hypothetical protein
MSMQTHGLNTILNVTVLVTRARASAIRSRRGKPYFVPMIHGPGAHRSGRRGGTRAAEPEPAPAQPAQPAPAAPGDATLSPTPSPPATLRPSLPPSPPAPSPPALLAGIGGSWMSVSFQSSHEEERFRRVCRALALIGYVYLFTASCSFLSSLYPVREEAEAAAETSVDVFLVRSNIIAIDLCIALFVICCFVAAYTHANMTAADWCEFAKIVSLYP